MIELRPYQFDAIARVREAMKAGKSRVLFALPTGGGKTIVAIAVIQSAIAKGKRVLFVAHRRELIAQTVRKLIEDGLSKSDIGVVMADGKITLKLGGPLVNMRNPGALVQVASIDTLRSRAKPDADLVFIDECHRALSKSYVDLADNYPNAYHLGLTATPYRGDGKGLEQQYDAIVQVASMQQLIDLGFLVEPRVFTVPALDMPDLDGVRSSKGDYDLAELEAALDKKRLVGSIVEHWLRRAEGRRTVVFAVGVAHSKHICEEFVAAGVRAAHLDAQTPRDERDSILARLDSGELQVVCNCGVLCEGWDQPSVKCCVLARPTKSLGLMLQQAGRILRPWQNTTALILDHAGNVINHGLPQQDRELTLEGKPKKSKDAVELQAKTCPNCFAILPRNARECPSCEFSFASEESAEQEEVKQEVGDLVEIRSASSEEQLAEWNRLCEAADKKGYKPGWCHFKFLEKFGHKAPKHFARPKRKVVTLAERVELFDELKAEGRRKGFKPGFAYARFKSETGAEPPSDREIVEYRKTVRVEVVESRTGTDDFVERVEWEI